MLSLLAPELKVKYSRFRANPYLVCSIDPNEVGYQVYPNFEFEIPVLKDSQGAIFKRESVFFQSKLSLRNFLPFELLLRASNSLQSSYA